MTLLPQTRAPRTFWGATIAVLLLVVMASLHSGTVEDAFKAFQQWSVSKAGWFLILTVNLLLLFALYLLVGPFGKLLIGAKDERPEFGTAAWLSMLFSAGMGIGLVFWGVAEPLTHFNAPPAGTPRTPEAASSAMVLTFFHWGLHAWGIYCVTGLALGYFAFRHHLPLTIRSAFAPILGRRIHGPLGDIVDTTAVLATIFGLATSLGLGTMQIAAGLKFMGWEASSSLHTELLIIAAVTAMAIASVSLGLHVGVRRLSEANMFLALALLLFVFVAGPTTEILNGLIQNTGGYLSRLISLGTWADTYRHSGWQQSWTVFYWAWWIAWAPFVGTFIARISRGRTIREYVLGVLLAPAGMTFVWLTVFGTGALQLELAGETSIGNAATSDPATALFAFLDLLPSAKISAAIALVVLVLFFVTSSDSGSLVVDSITSGGDLDPPLGQRVYWASVEGVVAATLLATGGLSALQAGAIATGLPFAVLLLLMSHGLLKTLRRDLVRYRHKASIHAPDKSASICL